MNTIYSTPAPGQHYRIELEQAKQDYQDGLLTAAGLLYYAIGIMRKPGQEVRLSVREWLTLTGLKERTFYSAKAKLIATGRINEQITGIVSLWICSAEDKVIELPTRAVNNDSSTGQTCQTLQNNCTTMQSNCTTMQDERTTMQEDCNNVRNEATKPAQSKASGVFPTNSTKPTKPTKPPKKAVKKAKRLQDCADLPADLKAKLEELEILKGSNRDKKVYAAIACHDLSQAYKAADHVKNTWENIDNPRGVFLFQLPRQRAEPLGSRRQVMTAKNFGYTINDLKKMYGTGWKQAAEHFGIEIEREVEEE